MQGVLKLRKKPKQLTKKNLKRTLFSLCFTDDSDADHFESALTPLLAFTNMYLGMRILWNRPKILIRMAIFSLGTWVNFKIKGNPQLHTISLRRERIHFAVSANPAPQLNVII